MLNGPARQQVPSIQLPFDYVRRPNTRAHGQAMAGNRPLRSPEAANRCPLLRHVAAGATTVTPDCSTGIPNFSKRRHRSCRLILVIVHCPGTEHHRLADDLVYYRRNPGWPSRSLASIRRDVHSGVLSQCLGGHGRVENHAPHLDDEQMCASALRPHKCGLGTVPVGNQHTLALQGMDPVSWDSACLADIVTLADSR